MTRRRAQLCAASLAGAAVGLAITPAMNDPLAGRVSTPEAWRRRVKAKTKISLLERSPNLITAAVLGCSVAEYALAYSAHGPIGSLQHVTVCRYGMAASATVHARYLTMCEGFAAMCERLTASCERLRGQLLPEAPASR